MVPDEQITSVDDRTLEHLERLARLEVPAEERDGIKADLSTVLTFVAQLADLAIGADAPKTDAPSAARPDVQRPSLGQAAALAVAPASRDGYFEVPRTVDEG